MIRTLLLLGAATLVVGQYSQYDSPLPPRPVIPGAVAVGGGGGGRTVGGRVRGLPQRARVAPPTLDEQDFAPRSRSRPPALPPQRSPRIRPQAVALPPPPPPLPVVVQPRPVVEPIEDDSSLDDEPLLNYPPVVAAPTPAPYRPPPPPPPKPQPTFKTIDDYPTPPRPQYRNTFQDEDLDIPTRTLPLEPSRGRPQYRPTSAPPTPPPPAPARGTQQSYNRQQQVARPSKKDSLKSTEDAPTPRGKKPTVQVIRKYREDNPDGSITWGFENDDGTYKEETIGVDCVTRGKYGYFDPEGVRREFTYSSGIPCDRRDEEEDDAEQQGSDHGYIDYTNNKYVMPNGDSVDLDHMVKNRARRPVQSYRN